MHHSDLSPFRLYNNFYIRTLLVSLCFLHDCSSSHPWYNHSRNTVYSAQVAKFVMFVFLLRMSLSLSPSIPYSSQHPV